jgi:aminopeptidase N
LLAATKDPNARVRARAIASLASSKDVSLSSLYQRLLNDQSYGVVRAAALALGQTKTPGSYDVLVKLLEVPSWHDTIRGSALGAFGALADKRALDIGFRYAGKGNYPQVRAAALQLLGNIGKEDPRVFPKIAETVGQAVEKGDFGLAVASADALVALGDPRGLAVFEEIAKQDGNPPQLKKLINEFQERLRKVTEGAAKPAIQQP